MVCNFPRYWVIYRNNLLKHRITLHDSFRDNYTKYVKEVKKRASRPLCRIILAVFDNADFWNERPDLTPRRTQGPIKVMREEYKFRHDDSYSYGLLVLLMVKSLLSRKLTRDCVQEQISNVRQHIVLTIFRFNTDSETFEPDS